MHWCPRFHEAYGALGGTLEYAAFEAVFKRSDAALAALPGIRTLGFRATIEAQARALAGLLPRGGAVDPESLAERLHADSVATIERNRPVLGRLAARFRLAVVSNFTGNLEPCLEELHLRALFGAVLDSGVLGFAKPDERIFLRALSCLGARAPDAWMVGDNPDADLRPAQHLGMRTAWVAPPARPGPSDFAPTRRIARLPELEAVLG